MATSDYAASRGVKWWKIFGRSAKHQQPGYASISNGAKTKTALKGRRRMLRTCRFSLHFLTTATKEAKPEKAGSEQSERGGLGDLDIADQVVNHWSASPSDETWLAGNGSVDHLSDGVFS